MKPDPDPGQYFDVDRYSQACIDAAIDQGLHPPKCALASAGIASEYWQSGGMTMVLVTVLPSNYEVWVTDDSAEDQRIYTVGLYGPEELQESTEALEYHEANLAELPSLVRHLTEVAEGHCYY